MRQKATIAVDRLVYKPPRLSSHRINKKYGAICPRPPLQFFMQTFSQYRDGALKTEKEAKR